MTHAVIFDFDGLLVDSEPISYRVYQVLAASFGQTLTIEEYAKYYSGKMHRNNLTDIVKRYQLPIDIQTAMRQTEVTEAQLLEQGVHLKPGAKQLLQYLKNHQYHIALGTSSRKERALRILRQHDLEHYFDVLVFGIEVERGKPYPDIFLKAQEKLTAEASSCLILEDSEAGIQAAFTAQIPVICIPDMKQPATEFQKMTLTCLTSLFDVISFLEDNNTPIE